MQQQDAWRSYLELARGLAERPRRRARKMLGSLVEQGVARVDQARAVAEGLLAPGRVDTEGLAERVRAEMVRARRIVGFTDAEELEELRSRVDELEGRLRAAEAGAPVTGASSATTPPAPLTPPAKKAAASKAAASRAVAEKAAAKKTAAKKAAATKAASQETTATRAAGPSADARKAAAARTAAAKKAAAKKTAAKKAAAKKTATGKTAAGKTAAKTAAKKTAAKKTAAQRPGGTTGSAGNTAQPGGVGEE
ncbi:MAG: histone H1-like repetitive region-containing protein [Actinocatenispora sp.]